MQARIMDDRAHWDEFIDHSRNGTLFHRWDFLDIQRRYTGYRLLRYGIFEGGTLVGVVPIFYNDKNGLKLAYSPPPTSIVYIPYQGIVTGPEVEGRTPHGRAECWNSIAGQLDAVVRKLSPNYVSLGLTPGIADVRPFIWNGYEVELRHTYVVDLDRPLKAVWESLQKECKRCVRCAEAYPLALHRADDVDAFIRAMRSGLDRLGMTFFHRQAPDYIGEVMAAFPDNVKMYFLDHGDDMIGAIVMCEYKGHSIWWMGGTTIGKDSEATDLSANDLLLWEMIKRAKEGGCRTFEHCGADEKRLNLAKTKINPALKPYFYLSRRDALYRAAKYGMAKIEGVMGQ